MTNSISVRKATKTTALISGSCACFKLHLKKYHGSWSDVVEGMLWPDIATPQIRLLIHALFVKHQTNLWVRLSWIRIPYSAF